ncbi:MAG: CoA transferase [Thermoplasmata archaeon]|nr:CoA transferase [Thermoplasmata archaeon]
MAEPIRPPALIPGFGPLEGVRVLDTGRLVAGPWAATYLGEFGAEVVHIEGPPFEPPYSDPTRLLPPWIPEGAPAEGAVSESWIQYSRNKLSVGLDLRRPEGVDVFLDLVGVSDIWVESSRPGTYDKLGISDQRLWARNPRLTIVHVSGYGRTGDLERIKLPSYDLIGQAFSGFLSLQGEPDPQPPMRSGTALNDTVTGLAAAAAGLMGYLNAQRTGKGQAVDVAQYEVFFTLLENLALDYFLRGVVRGRHGRGHARLYPYDLYPAQDGWVVVAAPTADSWTKLAKLVGISDRSFDDPTRRRAARADVDGLIEAYTSVRSAAELEALGRASDVAISRIYDIAAIAQDPHFRARGMLVEWDDPVAGRVKGAGIAPKFESTPGGVWRGAPWLGQDNEAVLAKLLNYPIPRIDSLRRSGVLGAFRPNPSDSASPASARRENQP